MRSSDPAQRWKENPFYVLGIAPGTSELELEREGRKLLAQLELGLASVRFAATPLGPVERSADGVRRALAALRDPSERRRHALWARLPVSAKSADAREESASNGRVEDAMPRVGWPRL